MAHTGASLSNVNKLLQLSYNLHIWFAKLSMKYERSLLLLSDTNINKETRFICSYFYRYMECKMVGKNTSKIGNFR